MLKRDREIVPIRNFIFHKRGTGYTYQRGSEGKRKKQANVKSRGAIYGFCFCFWIFSSTIESFMCFLLRIKHMKQ